MITTAIDYAFTRAWFTQLGIILGSGQLSAPRGKQTKEVLHATLGANMRYPVLRSPNRKLNYRFMAAEAYWILSGDDTVAGIVPYNAAIKEFSDDGKTFFGAYGPKVCDQLPYVIDALCKDDFTRQAGLTIWRESPPPTKDVPCTVALFFNIRSGYLNCSAFMRSSDAWLGLPYDFFNFSMIAHLVCAHVNVNTGRVGAKMSLITPGELAITMMSSHLYEPNWHAANACVDESTTSVALLKSRASPPTPQELYSNPEALMERLVLLRNTSIRDPLRWWEDRHEDI